MSSIQIPIDAITSRFGDRFSSLRSQSLGSRFANLRPLSEFLDFKRISKPANFGEAQSRVNYNLSYFSSNYAAIFVLLSIYSLLTNPMLLFVIFLVSGGLWGIGKLGGRDLDLGFARFNTSQLYTGLLLVAVPLGFWASPIATFLWLIGATGVTVFGHAAFMDKPIENAFSEEAV
ncbi:prenylated rab acceptor PRA1 [Aspergillus desertorum]